MTKTILKQINEIEGIDVERLHQDTKLKVLKIGVCFDNRYNGDDRLDYCKKKMNLKRIKAIIKKYYTFSDIEIDDDWSEDFWSEGSVIYYWITFKLWDVKSKRPEEIIIKEKKKIFSLILRKTDFELELKEYFIKLLKIPLEEEK